MSCFSVKEHVSRLKTALVIELKYFYVFGPEGGTQGEARAAKVEG